VLRRPPLGHVLPTAHDMAREYRVLSGLAEAGFPSPRPLALCEDLEVNGAPFYAMEYCEGVIIADDAPPGYAATAEERRRLSLALAGTLARLHSVDYRAVGLGDFGRPEGYLERQVRRWGLQWEQNKTRELPAIEELHRRLANAVPPSPPGTIVHGDYRLGNIILGADDPSRIVAVLDWEMSTLGDPLADLGWTLIYWGDPGDSEARLETHPSTRLTAGPGFLSRAELAGEYARLSGLDVSALEFYELFSQYKLAVISEGLYKRELLGQAVNTGHEEYATAAARLSALALGAADGAQNRRLRGR
jgi:aminoglycoside phosphotransferase (APT) family kinase protein